MFRKQHEERDVTTTTEPEAQFPAEGCTCDPPSHSGHFSYCALCPVPQEGDDEATDFSPVYKLGEPAEYVSLQETQEAQETRPIPVLDPAKPIDWLEAADVLTPYHVDPEAYPDDPDWAEFLRGQLRLAIWYLSERVEGTAAPDLATVARRAAVILNAEPTAPECERWLGVRVATQFEGQEVKCRNPHTEVPGSRFRYTAQPEDPYFDATTRVDGICVRCMLLETRTDAAVPVLTGEVVPDKPAVKPRPVKARTPKAVTSG